MTPWRLAGPSPGNSAANSGYSGGHLQSQSYADSATSQRYVLPRFTISTRTRSGEAAVAHPLLQPQPLRPHTSQFQPSQALCASNFPSSSSGANPQAWSNAGMFRGERVAARDEAGGAGRGTDREGSELPAGERPSRNTHFPVQSRHHQGAITQPHRLRPRGLHREDDDDEEEDNAAMERHRVIGSANHGMLGSMLHFGVSLWMCFRCES